MTPIDHSLFHTQFFQPKPCVHRQPFIFNNKWPLYHEFMLEEGSIYFCLQNVGLVLQSFLLHSANRQVIENCV